MASTDVSASGYVNAQEGDFDSAANIGILSGHRNLADYVAYGLDLVNVTYNSGSTSDATADLQEGKVYILLETMDTSTDTDGDGSPDTRHEVIQTAHYEAQTGISFPYDVNHVYAWFDRQNPDTPKLIVKDTDGKPTDSNGNTYDDVLKIAVLDTVNQTTDNSINRAPDGEYNVLNATTVNADTVDATDVQTDQVTFPSGTQSQPGLQDGDTHSGYNTTYDSDSSGVVDDAEHAQSSAAVDSGGTVPGGTVSGAIDNENNRYETTDGTGVSVDKAQQAGNASQLSNRSIQNILYEFGMKTGTVEIPITDVKDSTPTGVGLQLEGRNFKLWDMRLWDDGQNYTSLEFRVVAGDGTLLYSSSSDEARGDYTTDPVSPLLEVSSRSRIEIVLYHTEGGPIAASAVANYTLE